MPAVHDTGDINIDDIAIPENVVTGDPVADDIVDAGAAAFRVSEVSECGWCVSVLNREIVCESIDLAGRYTGLDESTEVIHQLSVETSGSAHAVALNFGKLQFAQVLQHLSLGSDAAWGIALGRIDQSGYGDELGVGLWKGRTKDPVIRVLRNRRETLNEADRLVLQILTGIDFEIKIAGGIACR